MNIMRKIIVDAEQDNADTLAAKFNDNAVERFETKPVAGFTALPCFGAFRCYGRISGERNESGGWTLKEEFFYGEGATVPENPKIDQTGTCLQSVSAADAAQYVVKFKPPSLDDGWF